MYYKGANMLHTIRTLINDDEKWRNILQGINTRFYHKTVTTQEIENYISQQSGLDLTKVFDQYLRTIKIPVFEYKIENKKIHYRWTNVIHGFNMPLNILFDGKLQQLEPTENWQSENLEATRIEVDENFYVHSHKLDL